jgi:beta-glucosidase
MGFKGFVVSDWGAVHGSDAMPNGADIEMPGAEFFNAWGLSGVNPEAIHEAAQRVLAAIYHLGLDRYPVCDGPCWSKRVSDQRTPVHVALAKEAAVDGVVLLKNNGTLPLRSVRKLAVVGPAASLGDTLNIWGAGSPYSGGGSGHVASTHVVTPLQGIIAKARAANVSVVSDVSMEGIVAGDPSSLQDADVAIFVAGTTAQESQDRGSLYLDSYADGQISAVANFIPTVVLLELPGPILMPWRDSVDAIACMFSGGEQTGEAWASVLFGDVSPSGRLPITMPASETNLIRPVSGNVVYNESIPSDSAPAYPLGHGLSYTRFGYGAPRTYCKQCDGAYCFMVSVNNVGPVPGREVVQVYLVFNREVQEPNYELRTFQKTPEIEPNRSAEVAFSLSRRDLSTYDVENATWRLETKFSVHLGASMRDIRNTFSVDLDDEIECEDSSSKPTTHSPHLLPLAFALVDVCILGGLQLPGHPF